MPRAGTHVPEAALFIALAALGAASLALCRSNILRVFLAFALFGASGWAKAAVTVTTTGLIETWVYGSYESAPTLNQLIAMLNARAEANYEACTSAPTYSCNKHIIVQAVPYLPNPGTKYYNGEPWWYTLKRELTSATKYANGSMVGPTGVPPLL